MTPCWQCVPRPRALETYRRLSNPLWGAKVRFLFGVLSQCASSYICEAPFSPRWKRGWHACMISVCDRIVER